MFNEILTGKATLEPSQAPAQPAVVFLDVTHSCVRCTKPYLAKSGSVPGYCPSCHSVLVQENAAESARAYNAAAATIRSSEASVDESSQQAAAPALERMTTCLADISNR